MYKEHIGQNSKAGNRQSNIVATNCSKQHTQGNFVVGNSCQQQTWLMYGPLNW